MEAKEGESPLPSPPSKISSLASPLERPDTQANEYHGKGPNISSLCCKCLKAENVINVFEQR